MNETASTSHNITYRSLPGSQGKAMTRSAKGTIESPGTNVKNKSWLNRKILKTSWGQLDQIPDYKCREVIKVKAVYTSRWCYLCGHTEAGNWTMQYQFECVACGHVDLNASTYILASGIGATARRGAFGLPTPKTREMDVWGTT